jgi:hypothetical protein
VGINVCVGNNAATNTRSGDLRTFQALGLYAIVGHDSAGLASIGSPAIIGWRMSPDEPDNAQPNHVGGHGSAVDPAKTMAEYKSIKAADSDLSISGLDWASRLTAGLVAAATLRQNQATC